VQRDPRHALLGRAPDILAELGRTDLVRAAAEHYPDLAAASLRAPVVLKEDECAD
jgi:hypothetical protein